MSEGLEEPRLRLGEDVDEERREDVRAPEAEGEGEGAEETAPEPDWEPAPSDEPAFRDLQPSFDLLYLFSPPEMLRFLFQQGSTGLWARFTPRALALACGLQLLIYVVATGWLWRSLCRRLRVEMKAEEPVTVNVPELSALAAEESLA